ncbi:MAG: cupin domain-containing protein [Vicinamibacterales bacterium]
MRILVSVAFGLATCLPSAALAQDPVKVDPAHHKVELDNADVRVLRITFAPGEKAPEHEHPNSVAVFLSDGTNRLTTPGQKPTENPQKRGDVVLVNAGKHSVENIGKTPTEVVLVELKKPGSAAYKGMSLDPTKLVAKNYSVVGENAHARVIHLRSAVGEPSVVHEHPSNVVIRLIDSATAKAGTVTWAPGPEKHGGTPSTSAVANDVIIVELKSGAGAK